MNIRAQHLLEERRLYAAVVSATWQPEADIRREIELELQWDAAARDRVKAASAAMIHQLRAQTRLPLIDQFLTEYGLSTNEGVQLMRLAEALSRTTDATTADALIHDKIAGQNWLSHSGSGHSFLMSLSARLLHRTDRWLQWTKGEDQGLGKAVARSGNGILRWATRTAVRALSSQFVFAETLEKALKRAARYGRDGYLFSFDMLGEAARTQADAEQYYAAYAAALDAVARDAQSPDPAQNHGISIKLSALHPRYEFGQAQHVVPEITAMLIPLAIAARKAHVQITIDAEEAERLDISMDVLSHLMAQPELHGWNGLGFVVQAYQRRARPLIDWLQEKAKSFGAPLYIRLVKGAYWDSEIKRAQEMGLESYPVFTRKEMTDLSYLACAQKLLAHPDCFVPQFATHNATSVAAIQELAGPGRVIEFQRLFGMGQQLHDGILAQTGHSSRIYAPVGTQKDLLSYLIRRLLENGANSSFVNKVNDHDIPVNDLVQDPATVLASVSTTENAKIPSPWGFLGHQRRSAAGWDLSDPETRSRFEMGLNAAEKAYRAGAIIDGKMLSAPAQPVTNPARRSEIVGEIALPDPAAAIRAVEIASQAFARWSTRDPSDRAALLERAADLLEKRASTFHYLAIKEAGKSWTDAIDEVREAVDFCRYYAARARDPGFADRTGLGVALCISPWNFPLAIFLGQVTAALAAGNSVVAKPADQTPLIAAEAVRLLHDAGVDEAAVHLVPGDGAVIGETLVAQPGVAAICFTGSTATARRIALRLAETGRAHTPLIAETGGINAMIVDSSALLEQTVDAVISSAFQSAGQRCSALRILCLQSDIADRFESLLRGAMDALVVGDPASLHHDIGPVIDAQAFERIHRHVEQLRISHRLVGETPVDAECRNAGHFVAPIAFALNDLGELDQEIFGPVLHVFRFAAEDKIAMVDQINASGYGLTLGIHSRIDDSCTAIASRANVGNIYINRNQIGAVVGVQPFGGQGLSGTGPKAGGPLYLLRLSQQAPRPEQPISTPARAMAPARPLDEPVADDLMHKAEQAMRCWQTTREQISLDDIVKQLPAGNLAETFATEALQYEKLFGHNAHLPAPAGETNRYRVNGRGTIVSLLQDDATISWACIRAIITGNSFVQFHCDHLTDATKAFFEAIKQACETPFLIQIAPQTDQAHLLDLLRNGSLGGVMIADCDPNAAEIGKLLSRHSAGILPILTEMDGLDRFVHEKVVTHNVAAAGGDVALLNAAL